MVDCKPLRADFDSSNRAKGTNRLPTCAAVIGIREELEHLSTTCALKVMKYRVTGEWCPQHVRQRTTCLRQNENSGIHPPDRLSNQILMLIQGRNVEPPRVSFALLTKGHVLKPVRCSSRTLRILRALRG
jgi:hypothetical protein